MIKMLRIDDRLIHGQVAVVWSKSLNISRIIVASDAISKNDIQKSALKMAAPEGIKTVIESIEKALKILNDPRAVKLPILLIMNDPKEVQQLLIGLSKNAVPENLNLANYGRIAGQLDEKEKISDTVYLTEDEIEIFKDLSEKGFKFVHQPLPSDQVKKLDELLQK